jgi:hypothetical protein
MVAPFTDLRDGDVENLIYLVNPYIRCVFSIQSHLEKNTILLWRLDRKLHYIKTNLRSNLTNETTLVCAIPRITTVQRTELLYCKRTAMAFKSKIKVFFLSQQYVPFGPSKWSARITSIIAFNTLRSLQTCK